MVSFLNEIDEVIRWPKKPSDKKDVIKWLSEKFKFDKQYSEKEINEIIDFSHSFNDTPLLRRELISQKFLDRKDDGSVYWRIN
jgi:hypothetical protein